MDRFGGRGLCGFSAVLNFVHEIRGNLLTGLTGGIIDAALGEGQHASARATLSVQAMEGKFLLLRRQAVKRYAGKLRSIGCISQEYLPRIHKGLYAGWDRHSQQRLDLKFILFNRMDAGML